MNARCKCPSITIPLPDGGTKRVPEWPSPECPVHWLRDGVDWSGHAIAGRNHPLAKYAKDVTISWCYVMPEKGRWHHWETSHTRKETPAEVMRRLYAEATEAA